MVTAKGIRVGRSRVHEEWFEVRLYRGRDSGERYLILKVKPDVM